MSTDCYLSAAPLTVAELDAKLAAAVALPGFRGFEPGLELRVSFEREELPPPALIAELGGSRLGAVVVTGELDPDELLPNVPIALSLSMAAVCTLHVQLASLPSQIQYSNT